MSLPWGIITLALGIGANTAVFELVDAVRLRSLPIHNPGELSELQIAGGNDGIGLNDSPYAKLTIPMWQEIQRHHEPFTGVFAWRNTVGMLVAGLGLGIMLALAVGRGASSLLFGLKAWDPVTMCLAAMLLAQFQS